MKENVYIRIVESVELSVLRLDSLVGYRGLVVEDLCGTDRKNRGALVLLEESYLDEFLWFIPEKSMSYE